MSEWRRVKLQEIVKSANTGLDAIQRAPICEENTGIKCLRIQDISQSKPFGNWGNARVKDTDFSKAQLLPGDLIMARTCSPGIVFHVEQKLNAVFNNGLARIRPNTDETNSLFLFYLFKSPDFTGHIYGISGGTSVQLNMKLGDLLSYDFQLPSLPEQRAIADVLSSLDDKIDLLHRQNKTLEALAETLFRQWFVEEASDDWETTTFAEHVDAFRGLSYKGSGLTELGLGLPMHNLNSVFEGGGYKQAGIKYYSGDYQQRHIVHSGDVIVTNTEQGHEFRLIGFPAIVPRHFGDTGIFSQHIYRVVPKEVSYLTRDFLYYLIMERDVREQIISATNGSTVNMLAIDGLQRPNFRLPPKSRVQEFTRFATESRQKRELNNDAVRTLEKLRDTLLPKLMSGEVSVRHE